MAPVGLSEEQHPTNSSSALHFTCESVHIRNLSALCDLKAPKIRYW